MYPKAIEQCISLYLPEVSSESMNLYGESPSIFTTMLRDQSPKVRCAAMELIQSILLAPFIKTMFPKTYRQRPASVSFRTLPEKITGMLRVAHSAMRQSLESEREAPMIVNSLKVQQSCKFLITIADSSLQTCSILVQNCPYFVVWSEDVATALSLVIAKCHEFLECQCTNSRVPYGCHLTHGF